MRGISYIAKVPRILNNIWHLESDKRLAPWNSLAPKQWLLLLLMITDEILKAVYWNKHMIKNKANLRDLKAATGL